MSTPENLEEKLRQQLDCKLEARETAACDLFQQLTPEEFDTYTTICRDLILNVYRTNTTVTKLLAETMFLGTARLGILSHDRGKFEREFGE